jgi:hypothetical protein
MDAKLFLRLGMGVQLLGSLFLSTSLIFLIASPEVLAQKWSGSVSRLGRLLRRILTSRLYRTMRFRPDRPDESIGRLFLRTYPVPGILLVIAVLGYVFSTSALLTLKAWQIVVALPFVVFCGLAFARTFHSKIARVSLFLFFAATSPLVYALLIVSAAFHMILLTMIGGLTLFQAWGTKQDVNKLMAVAGALLLLVGTGMQLWSTYLE